jgi:hypothetical protein
LAVRRNSAQSLGQIHRRARGPMFGRDAHHHAFLLQGGIADAHLQAMAAINAGTSSRQLAEAARHSFNTSCAVRNPAQRVATKFAAHQRVGYAITIGSGLSATLASGISPLNSGLGAITPRARQAVNAGHPHMNWPARTRDCQGAGRGELADAGTGINDWSA